jgi:hypothetical protein
MAQDGKLEAPMRIANDLIPIPSRPHPARRPPEAASGPAAGTALVPVDPVPERATAVLPSPRPSASFLTHLLATAERLPETRQRRRANEADASLAYRTGDPRTGARAAVRLSRTI